MKIKCAHCGRIYEDPEEIYDDGNNWCAECQLKDITWRDENE